VSTSTGHRADCFCHLRTLLSSNEGFLQGFCRLNETSIIVILLPKRIHSYSSTRLSVIERRLPSNSSSNGSDYCTYVLFSHWTGALKLNWPLRHYPVIIYPPSVIERRHLNTNRPSSIRFWTLGSQNPNEPTSTLLAFPPSNGSVKVLSVIERECPNTNQSSDGFVHSVFAPSVIERTR